MKAVQATFLFFLSVAVLSITWFAVECIRGKPALHRHSWSDWGRIQVAGGWYHWRRCSTCKAAQIEWWREWTKEESKMISTNASPTWMDGYLNGITVGYNFALTNNPIK